ncbi:MAG: hypothetical protein ACLGG5_07515 [Thermoleophilia bacterium]
MFAHIAGVPVEETALSMAPVASVVGAAALMNLRRGVARRHTSVKRLRLRDGHPGRRPSA